MLMVLFPSCRGRFRRFVVPLPALIGLAIAGSWFAYQVQLSPMAMYDQFIRDEVISKLEFSLGAVISSVGLSVTSLLLPLAGWLIVTAAAWLKTGKRPGLDVLGNSVRLFVGWIIVNIAFFAPAIKPDHRYIIPSIPALSVLTAAAIAHLSQPTATHYLGRFMKFLAIALGLVFAVLIIVTAQLISVPMLAIMGCGIAAGLIVLWRVATAAGYDGMVVTLAAVPMSVMLALYPVVSAFGMPDVGQPIAAEIRKLDLPADQIVVVDMDIVASEVRLHSGVTIPFKQVSDFEDILDAQSRPMSVYKAIITLDNKSADLLANLGYNVTIVIGGWRHVRVSTLIDAVLSGTLTEAKRNEGDKAYIAVRPE